MVIGLRATLHCLDAKKAPAAFKAPFAFLPLPSHRRLSPFMSTMKPELLIEVYTDPMCPWCWIGNARLQETLKSKDFNEQIATKMQPVVRLKPYLLDTRLPGTDYDPPSEKYDSAASPYSQRQPPTKREYFSKKWVCLVLNPERYNMTDSNSLPLIVKGSPIWTHSMPRSARQRRSQI